MTVPHQFIYQFGDNELQVWAQIEPFVPGFISGPPEACYPDEGGTAELSSVEIGGDDVEFTFVTDGLIIRSPISDERQIDLIAQIIHNVSEQAEPDPDKIAAAIVGHGFKLTIDLETDIAEKAVTDFEENQ